MRGRLFLTMPLRLRKVRGQSSWRLKSAQVEAFVTEQGGHLGPVKFKLGARSVEPLAVAPWAREPVDSKLPQLLKVLRGDFFCLPFGGNTTPFRGERHPPHGETANAKWRLCDQGPDFIHLSLRTRIRRGRVDKYVSLKPGHSAIYIRHQIQGMTGPMSLGHHAMLQFPDVDGCGRISTSGFRCGQVLPTEFEQARNRGYSSLQPGSCFRQLEKVPMAAGGVADLSLYPARRGFEDLVMLTSEEQPDFAWTAVTFPEHGYVWFALKDPRVLRHTVFWLSNGGRHYAPWNGRHVNVLGLEEVTSYFHYGLAESAAANPVAKSGLPTCIQLNPQAPLTVNYIMAVAAIPKRFDRLAAIRPLREDNRVELRSTRGLKVQVPLDWRFVTGS